MATSYPGGLDSFTNPTSGDDLDDSVGGRTHSQMHADVNDAMEAVQAELGTNPSGSEATVAARLAFVGARVYNNGNLAAGTGTNTYLTFNTERYDTSSIHSTSSNTSRLTVPTTGYYSISASVMFAANIQGVRGVDIRLNGSTQIAQDRRNAVLNSDVTLITLTTTYQLTAGDYVELGVYQTSGVSLNVVYTGNFSPEFMIHKIG